VAEKPTIHIVASDANRNGKTLLARLITDYLLLDKRDPFLIDTDAPEGPLRHFFPGRTVLADFEKTPGQMKVFDTILGAPRRDYVVDLPQRHMHPFFTATKELNFWAEARAQGFRIFVYFIVDRAASSLKAGREIEQQAGADLFIAVRNDHVGSSWPATEPSLHLSALPQRLSAEISDKRFSLSQFVLGDEQQLSQIDVDALSRFLVDALDGINGLDTAISLAKISMHE
jgi:hypothetical protein